MAFVKTTRTELASKFIEPDYTTINGINPADMRGQFQTMLTELQARGVDTVAKAGGDVEHPKNAHVATIHHTAFLIAMDQAKDHYIKWVLACAAETR